MAQTLKIDRFAVNLNEAKNRVILDGFQMDKGGNSGVVVAYADLSFEDAALLYIKLRNCLTING